MAIQKYLAWARDSSGAMKTISADTEAEAQKGAAEKGWSIVVGQFGAWPTKPEEKPTVGWQQSPFEAGATYGPLQQPQPTWTPEQKIPRATTEDVQRIAQQYLGRPATAAEASQWTGGVLSDIERMATEQREKTLAEIKSPLVGAAEIGKPSTAAVGGVPLYSTEGSLKTPEQFFSEFKITMPDFSPVFEAMAKTGFKIPEIEKVIETMVDPQLKQYEPMLREYLTAYETAQAKVRTEETLAPYKTELERLAKSEAERFTTWKTYYEGQIKTMKESAEKSKEKIETRITEAKADLKSFYNLATQRVQTEMNSRMADVEDTRLKATDYLRGQLSKMGALQTTGASATAQTNLEEKYQRQANEMRSSYSYQLTTLDLTFARNLKDLDEKKEDKIAEIELQLWESAEKKNENLMKLNEEITKNINTLNLTFIKEEMNTLQDSLKEARSNVEKYLKSWWETASGGAKADYLLKIMPMILQVKAETKAIDDLKDKLDIQAKRLSIQRTQQLMAGGGKTPADIDYLAGMVYRGEKTLASLTTEQEILVRKKLETPTSEWLTEKGYQTDVSFLPTSKVAKEWQAEVSKRLTKSTDLDSFYNDL